MKTSALYVKLLRVWQDNDKGIIIGRRSFGKGLVQLEMDLGDGSAVRTNNSKATLLQAVLFRNHTLKMDIPTIMMTNKKSASWRAFK